MNSVKERRQIEEIVKDIIVSLLSKYGKNEQIKCITCISYPLKGYWE